MSVQLCVQHTNVLSNPNYPPFYYQALVTLDLYHFVLLLPGIAIGSTKTL